MKNEIMIFSIIILCSMNVHVIDLEDYDYLLLGCGYIDRLHEKAREIIRATEYDTYIYPISTSKSHDLVYFIYFSAKKVVRFQPCIDMVSRSALVAQEEGRFTMKDSVCIRKSDYSHKLVKKLKSYHHCASFTESSIPSKIVSFITFTGKKVLYLEYDTESE